jgi:hypothetical protein
MTELNVPSVHWGRALIEIAAITAAVQTLIFLRRGALNPAMSVMVALCLLLVVFRRSRIPLTVRAGTLSGPDRSGLRHVRIRLVDIDHGRSAEVGWFGARTIWSHAGQAVHLDATNIPKTQRQKVLAAIGVG